MQIPYLERDNSCFVKAVCFEYRFDFEYRTRAKISNAYSKLTRVLDALIFEHFQNLSYILANFNVFKACLWLKYTFKTYCYALVSTIISKK